MIAPAESLSSKLAELFAELSIAADEAQDPKAGAEYLENRVCEILADVNGLIDLPELVEALLQRRREDLAADEKDREKAYDYSLPCRV